MIEKSKRINVKDVAYWVAMAWAGVRASTIVKSWKKLLGDAESMETESTSTSNDDDQYEITDEEIVALATTTTLKINQLLSHSEFHITTELRL
ncbi:hypothetical protein QE152_g30359 [Popillia japonica]|uniref:DDE-1 domain-containing protein n=1 Tax=Popillia japonica TaxID=7064 RepID=A0AAW1JEY1_POPJA